MHNFYNLNHKETSSATNNASTITLDINLPLYNQKFYDLMDKYIDAPTAVLEDELGDYLNKIHYLIGIIPNSATSDFSERLTISLGDTLELLICETDQKETYLPVFTDSREVSKWYNKSLNTISVPAFWLWRFVTLNRDYNGIILNPGSIAWTIKDEHIRSLLDDILIK